MEKRTDTFALWSNTRTVPGARLVAFESWLFEEMSTRLVWPRDSAERAKMIGQCRTFTMEAIADLDRHGFLFQPKELAKLLREKLDQIGTLQRQGKVENLYPYFRACWQGWVRREADALRDRAMSIGCHVTQHLRAIGSGPTPTSMPELVAQSLREQAAEARRKVLVKDDGNLKFEI